MLIHILDDNNDMCVLNYDNVANLEAFEREMDEAFEVWSYDYDEILAMRAKGWIELITNEFYFPLDTAFLPNLVTVN